ncbi:eCIS core domain-containing protein [Streptomyces sp. 6N223]|uniref:eCIS core domain-containing protein n=1 Tax=Streptomyces sp. 6N223 TaxID=3457412 RepID=UPI003FD0C1BA
MHAHEHEHEHDESPRQRRTPGALDTPAELPHLLRAAVAGRPDVIGRHGMGTLQRTVGNAAVGSALPREPGDAAEETAERSSVHDVIASGGDPLEGDVRRDMEARLGADFSDVRVHTGTAAHESAQDVGARAYTVGSDVVFQRDAYDPASSTGRTTLAHELTHVIQQRSGPVDGTEAPGGIRVSDPSDRFEQEAAATAERVMSQPAPAAIAPAPAEAAAPAGAPAPVQRQSESEGEDEEPADVQGEFVQRTATDAGAQEEEEAPPEA